MLSGQTRCRGDLRSDAAYGTDRCMHVPWDASPVLFSGIPDDQIPTLGLFMGAGAVDESER